MGSTHPKIQGTCKTAQSVTVDFEALSALFTNSSDEGMTVFELADLTGLTSARVRKMIKQGVLAGKVTIGRRYVACDWDNRSRSYTVYRMNE